MDPLAEKIFDHLATNYPSNLLGWIKETHWSKKTLPLKKIDMEEQEKENPKKADDPETESRIRAIKEGITADPVVVMKKKDGHYSIVDGHHRIRSFRLMDKHKIKAYVGKLPGFADPWHTVRFAPSPVSAELTSIQSDKMITSRNNWLDLLAPSALHAQQTGDWGRFATEADEAISAFVPSMAIAAGEHRWDTAIRIATRQLAINVQHYLSLHQDLPPDRLMRYARLVNAAELQRAITYVVHSTSHPQERIRRSIHSDNPCAQCLALEGDHNATDPGLFYWHPNCACTFKTIGANTL